MTISRWETGRNLSKREYQQDARCSGSRNQNRLSKNLFSCSKFWVNTRMLLAQLGVVYLFLLKTGSLDSAVQEFYVGYEP